MRRILTIFSLVAVAALSGLAQNDGEESTVIRSPEAARRLVGKHKISLQWISWEHYGSATVMNKVCRSVAMSERIKGRCYWLSGQQNGRGNSDSLNVSGMITAIDAKEFRFEGTITTQVSHINDGKPCVRSGAFTFRITGKRKYWRLMEMDNPCDGVTDYVDIYFR